MVRPPQWIIQQPVPVLKAHYHFVSSAAQGGNLRFVYTTEFGHQVTANQLLYTYILPPGDKVSQQANGGYDLTAENIPALPQEDYLPPFYGWSEVVSSLGFEPRTHALKGRCSTY